MKTNLVVVNQGVLDQLFKLAEHEVKTSTNPELNKDLVNLRNNIFALPAEAERKFGEQLIEVLHLKIKGDRVETDWGSKTPIGLFRTIASQMEEIQVDYEPGHIISTPLI